MTERVDDPETLAALLEANAPDGLIDSDFSAADWLMDPNNIALRIGDDLAMFEGLQPGLFRGHVWFASRGKQALEHGRTIIAAMLSDYGAETIIGETPVDCVAALGFVRKLGFKAIGLAMKPQGQVVVSQLIANHPAARLVA